MSVQLLTTRIFIVVMLAATSTATAQTSDDLFDAGTLNDLRLFMNSRDLQQLRDTFEENTYYQGDLEWRRVPVRSGVNRTAGPVSPQPQHAALRLHFDRYIDRPRLLRPYCPTLRHIRP